MSESKDSMFEQIRNYKVRCPHCDEENPLHKWGFVQTFWYERPYSCNGGAEWWPNKDIKQCLLVCLSGDAHAVRIYDLLIERQEKNWVFGLIQKETHLHTPELFKIFARENYWLKYGDGDIINFAEREEEKISADDMY